MQDHQIAKKDSKEIMQSLKTLINSFQYEEETTTKVNDLLKSLEKELIASEFKLKRTQRDRQITVNVLSNTIQRLEEKSISIEQHKQLIEEQSKFKEKLFANVSHELRTPLHGILGMNQLLEITELNPVQKNYVDIIKNSADNLLVIINDLLSFSQINDNKIKIQSKPFSILKLCKDLQNNLSQQTKKKGLNLITNLHPNLPEFLIGDKTRIYQILLNLLNNAVKFTHEGYVSLNIYIIEKSQKEISLQFEIKDTGIGIEPKRLDMIYESFTQVHDDHGVVYEGAGLGLNIVKNLLNIMDGEIEVKSEKGKGSTFLTNLPFEIPDQALIQEYTDCVQEKNTPPNWKNKNILLIEDNKANILFAKNMFLEWGVELQIAETIKDAEKAILNEKFDCIVSDVKLPDGNGLELISQMRANSENINKNTPVMVMTASCNEKEARYSKEIQVQSYLAKPFKVCKMVEDLKIMLEEKPPLEKASYTVKSKMEPHKSYFEQLDNHFGGKNMLKMEMMDIFLDQIPETLQKMDHALLTNDLESFHFEAHSIKSTIFNIGLPKLEPIISKINNNCYNNTHLEDLPKLFEYFKDVVTKDVQLILKKKTEFMELI